MGDMNIWAVLVSGLVYFIFGGVWYAAVFSRQYQEGLGFNEEEKKEAEAAFPKALATHLVSGLVTAFVMAAFISAGSFMSGVKVGALLWLGFALTINLNYLMFERRPMTLFTLNNGFFLIAFAIMGGILAIWR